LKNVTRAKVLSPMTDKGESSLMLLDFVQSQSAAAAQGTSIAMGTYHTLCLMSEEVQCCRGWELSLPTGPNREVEGTATVAATTAATSASTSAATTCSSSADARTYGVYSFGRGFHGQLGTGLDHSDSSLPTRIEDVSKGEDLIGLDTPDGKDIRLAVVHAGSSHSMAISRRGELFTWGLSSSGELGHGTWSPTVRW
jgi:E3 ubiquitin-protein ligase HERC3